MKINNKVIIYTKNKNNLLIKDNKFKFIININ